MFYVTTIGKLGQDKQTVYENLTSIRKEVCKKLAKEKQEVKIDRRQLMPMLNYLHKPYKIIKIVKK